MTATPYARAFHADELSGRRVLLVAQGPWHLDMYASFFTALPEVDWTVYFEAPGDALMPLAQAAPSNVQLIGNLTDVLLRLDEFAVCLTTLATPHRAHLTGLQIFTACSRLGLPVLEVQHGLFQQGMAFVEVSRTPGSGFANAAMGAAARNFRDDVVGWSGDAGIGLPQFHDLKPASDDGYVLILSNQHRSVFSEIERRLFYEGVAQLVRRHPDTRFLWKPHQAELQRKLEPLYAPLMALVRANLELLTRETMAGQTTLDLIRCCSSAVSSLSSVVLELEMYAKPTLLYAPASMEGAVAIMGTVHPFVDDLSLLAAYDDLLQRPGAYRMRTGFLKPFEPDRLRAVLKKNWRSQPISKAALAQAILPSIEFLELTSTINRMKSDLRSVIKG